MLRLLFSAAIVLVVGCWMFVGSVWFDSDLLRVERRTRRKSHGWQ